MPVYICAYVCDMSLKGSTKYRLGILDEEPIELGVTQLERSGDTNCPLEERGQQAPRGREPVPVEHSSWGCGAGGWKPQCFPAAEAQRTPLGAKPKDEALWSFSRSLLRSRPGVASESLPLGFGGRP